MVVADRNSVLFNFLSFPFCADLKKQFSLQPQSQRVELGARVEIRCGLPSGMPLPTLHWLKNGAPLQEQQQQPHHGQDHQAAASALLSDTSMSSALVTADGNVLIHRATLNVSKNTITSDHKTDQHKKQEQQQQQTGNN